MSEIEQFARNVALLQGYGFRFSSRLDYSMNGESDGTKDHDGEWAVWDDAEGMGGPDGFAIVGDDPAALCAEAVSHLELTWA